MYSFPAYVVKNVKLFLVAPKKLLRYINNKFTLNLKIGALFVMMHDYAICEIWRILFIFIQN